MFSCNEKYSKQEDSNNIDEDVKSLNTIEKKEIFLVSLFSKDQSVRNEKKELEILKRNGFDMSSDEYQEYVKEMITVDSINFLHAKKYLESYGYPASKNFSYKASYAITTICLHQRYEKQLILFPFIYRAYKNKDLSRDDFSFLLNRMHINKYGDSHPHAVTNEENIKELLDKLELNSEISLK